MSPELKKQIRKVPLPEGVKWSNVFQVMLMAAVAEKKGISDYDFKKQLAKNEKYVKVREWMRETIVDYIEDDD